jgi:nicotinamide riboside transporter PnuC
MYVTILEVTGKYGNQWTLWKANGCYGVINFHGKSKVAVENQCLLCMSLVAMGRHWLLRKSIIAMETQWLLLNSKWL